MCDFLLSRLNNGVKNYFIQTCGEILIGFLQKKDENRTFLSPNCIIVNWCFTIYWNSAIKFFFGRCNFCRGWDTILNCK